MRNLKRALSLGLTAAMISGLMVMGSSAASSSYTDVADTDNVEAIEVLKAVGIMVGDENGDFNPDENVTRNEMAVVMSNLMAYNVATYADTSPFTDVPSWAEPYVAACWTNGITAGTSDTTYGGSEDVTTAQAALMLMKALGYFQYSSDFGSDWQLSTISQGNKIDLFENVDSGVQQAMTRNDLAQLVLNTLEAGTVEAESDGSFQIGDISFASNVTYKYVTSGRDYAYAINDRLDTNNDGSYSSGAIVELGEKLYNGDLTKEENGRDDFGRPANIWEYQANEIGTFADSETYTFTSKVTSKDLYDAIGRTAMDYPTWNVFVDGEEVDYTGDDLDDNKSDDDGDFLEEAGVDLSDVWNEAATGNGVLTQVYVDGTDRTVDISVIHYYAAEVYEVDEDEGTTTLSALYGPASTNDEYDTTAFEEDDIVMYSFAANEVQEIYAAEEMSGEVTRVRSNTNDGKESDGDNFTADGTDYSYNKTMLSEDRLVIENVDNDVVAYLDQYGYVAYIDESAMTYDYAYVLSMGTDGDQYDNTEDSRGTTVYARLVLTDGTLMKVETDNNVDEIDDLRNHIVSYSTDSSDVYTLSVRDMDDNPDDNMSGTEGIQDADDTTLLNIENGVASFKASTDRYTANSNTVFIVADSDDDSYDDYDFSIYTGVKNVPDIAGQAGAKVDVAADEDGVAKVVYVEDADVSGSTDVIYALADTDPKIVRNSDISDYYEIDAVVNGEVVTLNVKTNSTAAEKLVTDIAANGADMYEVIEDEQWIVALEGITENSDGLVTNVRVYDPESDGDGFVSGTGTGKAENETVRLDDESSRFAWDDEVVVVRYDYKGDFSVSRISSIKTDANDGYVAVLDSNVLTGICIIENDGGEGENDDQGATGNLETNLPGSDADVSYTVASSGRVSTTIEYTAPEYAADDATVEFEVNVYENNDVFVDSFTVSETVSGGETITITDRSLTYDGDSDLSFEMVDEEVSAVQVQLEDTDGNPVAANSSMTLSMSTQTSGTYHVRPSTTAYNNTDTYSVTAVDGMTTTTTLPTTAVAVSGGSATALANAIADGDDYVTITLNMSGVDARTFNITQAGPFSTLFTSGHSISGITNNAVTSTDTLIVDPSKETGIAAGETVNFTVALPGGVTQTGIKAYRVTLTIGDNSDSVVLTDADRNGVISLPITEDVAFDRSNITVTAIETLSVTGVVAEDDKTVTLTFSESVTGANGSTITATGVNYITVTPIDSTTVRVVASEALTSGDTIVVNGVSAADTAYGTDTLTSHTLTVGGTSGDLTLS